MTKISNRDHMTYAGHPEETKPLPTVKSLSFFSGCLGLDLGLESYGINQLLTCDSDKFCRETIQANRPGVPILDNILGHSAGEIRKIAGLESSESLDLIIGGPPCQAFSTAGKRTGFVDTRGNVFLRFIELALELLPKYVVIENVRGLLSMPIKFQPRKGIERVSGYEEKYGGAMSYILNMFHTGGYSVSFNLYNAANYSTPQKRERLILIATKTSPGVPYLQPTHSDNPRYKLKPWTTFEEATLDLEEQHSTGLQFSSKRIPYFKMLGPGENWKNLPSDDLKKDAMGKSYYSGGGKTGFYRRLAWNEPSPTLVTHPAMPATDLAHPELDRPLSIQEYRRLQQFPDNWIICGSITEQYKQLGNAVPVGLGQAVGKALVEHIQGKCWDQNTLPGFPYSRYKGTGNTQLVLST